jgi:hypothetical protein
MRARLTSLALTAALAAACGGRDDSVLDSSSSPEKIDAPDSGSVVSPPPNNDAAPFAACSTDTDCIAVPKVGCCHLGFKAAVAKNRADAYSASFHCPNQHPICIEILVIDDRTARCNASTHMCELVGDSTSCGGASPCLAAD